MSTSADLAPANDGTTTAPTDSPIDSNVMIALATAGTLLVGTISLRRRIR